MIFAVSTRLQSCCRQDETQLEMLTQRPCSTWSCTASIRRDGPRRRCWKTLQLMKQKSEQVRKRNCLISFLHNIFNLSNVPAHVLPRTLTHPFLTMLLLGDFLPFSLLLLARHWPSKGNNHHHHPGSPGMRLALVVTPRSSLAFCCPSYHQRKVKEGGCGSWRSTDVMPSRSGWLLYTLYFLWFAFGRIIHKYTLALLSIPNPV